MFPKVSLAIGCALLCSFVPEGLAEVSLASIFTDAAVLQRDKPVPVWGKAAAGETVTVEFQGQKKQAVADGEGRWKVELDALPASSTPASLRVKGSAEGDPVELKGILVGEVWLCSGQSNMQWIVSRSNDAAKEAAAADYPAIRMFRIRFSSADKPLDKLETAVKWSVCDPRRVGSFSAVAYYFARDLHRELGVPIGIINSSWGGTQIESWMSAAALAKTPYSSKITDRWQERLAKIPAQTALYEKARAKWEAEHAKEPEAGAAGASRERGPRPPQGLGSRWVPAGLFNGMVHPLVPYAMRGIAWYQGETNAPRYGEYGALFQAMIRQWREDFAQGELPFFFVQIANYLPAQDASGVQWAFQREAQATALQLPNTGMAVTIDIGDPRHVHFTNKQDVGRRLALVALAKTYAKEVVYAGPAFKEAKQEGSRLRISFQPETDLVLKEADPTGFEVAGVDKVFHPATAVVVDGRAVLVSSASVPKPVAVRYAWHDSPAVSLYGKTGLPAPPFRSDNWPGPQSQSKDDGDLPE